MSAAPAADDHDVDAMRRLQLMDYAKSLGLETRREGKDGEKTLYRLVDDVKRECKEAHARHCQAVGPEATLGK